VPVTDELYDLVLFVVHSFVRPIATELSRRPFVARLR